MITKRALGIIFFILAQPGLNAVEQQVPIPEGMYPYFAAYVLERKKQSLLFGFRHVSPTGSINDEAYGSKIEIILVGDGKVPNKTVKILSKTVKILHSVVDKSLMQLPEFPKNSAFDVVNSYIFLESEDLVNAKKVVISKSGLTVEIILPMKEMKEKKG